ncbi:MULTISPECIES: HAD family hydrolase [unclassified Pseudomonas]|uniref:HAD family hydrolase n=1 Tax=unclassified Pseudomonas TaxID=196821 RepID=UPI002AC96D32|nr:MULTISPECIES: HAD family hydrolase [unclassified Pseudomonas]MEB0039910.1 HAD family hydrolase [Pseudomonas sp. MH10]MEB0077149.1 HAD family hydrolase [Pseudomonas sp. MH10out]MEB0093052.1 HAD family hydrolase [Pseudomonas sp. CCI4.2]MEB0102256.1 HAD family hydrolase [Pseudomonas sp. CCI3.2]MEB0123528.1 HAD family hydrolase [Pseudomonas sp. CCI1.2]
MSARSSVFNGHYNGFLFDMDGTLINSIAAAERIWATWARAHGVEVDTFLPTIHGARAVDTIKRLGLVGVDPELEALAITEAEIADLAGIVEVAGAAAFVKSLPANKWAIVTSAPKELAIRRLEVAGIPLPAVFITSEDVSHGKPNPDCYLLAAQQLGVNASDCLVFEDAPVGILAGEAAGAAVMVVTATHVDPMDTSHASIMDYQRTVVRVDENGVMRLEA